MNIALLGSYSTQFLSKELQNIFEDYNLYEAEFSQIDLEIINENSGLYNFKPDYLIIHETVISFRENFYAEQNHNMFYKEYISKLEILFQTVTGKIPNVKIIYPTFDLETDMVFGNFYSKVESSFDSQLNYFNYELNKLSLKINNLYLLDINQLALKFRNIRDYRMVVNSELHFSISFTKIIAENLSRLINALEGKFKKCIILDLDNTLWGGVIGDDGIDSIQIGNNGIGKAFSLFQKWLKQLKNRGIILCICSKNDRQTAEEPFLKHSEMVLSLNDFAIFVANWNNKVDNIKYIKSVLNIGYDSMVFIDDNPAERDLVLSNIKDIEVPDLPQDPAEYLPFLIKKNLFEVSSFSKNDHKRTEQYQSSQKRLELEQSSVNMVEYLKSLEMLGLLLII